MSLSRSERFSGLEAADILKRDSRLGRGEELSLGVEKGELSLNTGQDQTRTATPPIVPARDNRTSTLWLSLLVGRLPRASTTVG